MGARSIQRARAVHRGLRLCRLARRGESRGRALHAERQALQDARGVHASRFHAAAAADAAGARQSRRPCALRRIAFREERHAAGHGKVLVDLGAYLRHAKQKWGYEKILLCGWSGGGSLALFYQAQAEKPTITRTPAGDAVDLRNLVPADAMIFQAAHLSRARMLAEWIDPSVSDENDPDRRDLELDIYHPGCPNQPPYSKEFVARFRAAQLARMRRKTAWVKE